MNILRYSFLCTIILTITACSGMPQLFWPTEKGGSSHAVGNAKVTQAQARAPLELPPELRADIELPMANKVANAPREVLSERYTKAVAGKAVTLKARVYDTSADQVFSAVVDAMTSLNIPVESVDSPSGIVTSDWVRSGSQNYSTFGSMLGQASSLTRHRFVVRVFRLKTEGGGKEQTRLEVRSLLQVFSNKHWVNTPMNQKHIASFFTTVEEQLGRMVGEQTANPLPQQ